MSVTMKEIARIAGVSRQAVAAALSDVGTSKVSPATRERVKSIARSLHYIPNLSARSLKGAASMTIGIYGVPYASVLSQCFFNELSVFLDRKGYNLMACYGMNEEASEQAVRRLMAKGIDGMIVTTQDNPLVKWDLPATPNVFAPPGRIDGFDVVVDHAAGTAKAVSEMLKRGRKRFVYVTTTLNDFYARPNQEKYRGFSEALADAGMSAALLTIEECGGRGDKLLEQLKKLAPDTIFCSNDYFAGRLISLLLSDGVKIPDDVMMIGYDGLAMCDLCAVSLTTIVQPVRQMAEKVVDLLLERIEAKTANCPPAGIELEPYFYPSASIGVMNEKMRSLPIYNSYSSLEANWYDAIYNINSLAGEESKS